MVGLLTLVTNRVGSVTSTSFRVNFGDMRTFSGPMLPVSSGTLPGHSSTTIGLSAPAAGQAAHNQVIRETVAAIRCMVAPLFSEPVEHVENVLVCGHVEAASSAGYVTIRPPERRQIGFWRPLRAWGRM